MFTPVGVKCRECASPTRGMIRAGKPDQYAGAILAGLAASVIGGLVLSFTIRGSILISIIFGLLIGEAVRRGARGNKGPSFMAIAGVTAFIGQLLAGIGLSPMGLILSLVTAGVAASRLSE